MLCPIDQSELVMTERSGVEIDYCPKCRGVWLDRGELDKVLERSAAAAPGGAQYREQVRETSDDDRRDQDRYDDDDRYDDRRPAQGGLLGKVGQALGDRDRDRDRDQDRQGYDRQGRPRKKKRESFLDDLFDF